MLILNLVLHAAVAFAGPTYDMGNGKDEGQLQQITSWNNEARSFGSAAQEWKQKYPPEKVKRSPNGQATSGTIEFCLNGKKVGTGLLQSGNGTSLKYEAYLATKPGDPNVIPAYTDHETNLHSLHNQFKQSTAAAKCE